MIFHLTEHCSLGCPHCAINSTPNNWHARERIVKRFIRFAKEMGTINIGIAGGEPTEHPEFFKYFGMIIRSFNEKVDIALMTNGRFLLDKHFVNELAVMQQRRFFDIQVSAFKDLYPHWEETTDAFIDQSSKFKQIRYVEGITCIDQLGRAKGKDWSHITTYKRVAPNCINVFSVAKEDTIMSLREVIKYLDTKTKSFCKPLISQNGTIHAGETPTCVKIGTLLDHKDSIHALKHGLPCGKCGLMIPKDMSFREYMVMTQIKSGMYLSGLGGFL